jgi:hypothetical protein
MRTTIDRRDDDPANWPPLQQLPARRVRGAIVRGNRHHRALVGNAVQSVREDLRRDTRIDAEIMHAVLDVVWAWARANRDDRDDLWGALAAAESAAEAARLRHGLRAIAHRHRAVIGTVRFALDPRNDPEGLT